MFLIETWLKPLASHSPPPSLLAALPSNLPLCLSLSQHRLSAPSVFTLPRLAARISRLIPCSLISSTACLNTATPTHTHSSALATSTWILTTPGTQPHAKWWISWPIWDWPRMSVSLRTHGKSHILDWLLHTSSLSTYVSHSIASDNACAICYLKIAVPPSRHETPAPSTAQTWKKTGLHLSPLPQRWWPAWTLCWQPS